MSSGFTHDPHSEQGNACPRNRFGISDYEKLQPIETAFAFKRARELEARGITGKFDTSHLKSIHQHLFRDVFPWAGEFRVVNIWKGNSMFGPALHISAALTELLEKLRREDYLHSVTRAVFCARAAFYLGEINAIHPFREGNGRTQRDFIRQLGLHAGHPISWAGFTQQQMTDASILSHTRGDCSQLAAILGSALL